MMENKKIYIVDELDASSTWINMKVRIIRRWVSPIQMLEMVLLDKRGAKIQCSVKKERVPIFSSMINEDVSVIIKRFGVGQSDDPFPVVKNKLKCIFYRSTEVLPDVSFIGHPFGFSFCPFEDITIHKVSDENTLTVDVIGCVCWCGNLELFRTVKGEFKKSVIELKNLEGITQRYTLWNQYAIQFNEFLKQNVSVEHVIIIIQHAKLNVFRGNVNVQSDKFGTRLFINDDLQEVNDFRRRLIVHEGPGETSTTTLSSQTVYPNRLEFLLNTVKKNLDEVIEAEEVGEFVVVATIAHLKPQFGWFYVSCKNCNRKVISKNEYLQIADVEEVTEELLNAPSESIWCRKEKKMATQTCPKFRITMRVEDSTGTAAFVMWDREVQNVLGLSASDIRQRQLRKNDDNSFPTELDGLLNWKIGFKIKIDDYLVRPKGGAYTIIKICDDPEIISELISQDDNTDEVLEEATVLEMSPVKLGEESQIAIDSPVDVVSVTADSSTGVINLDYQTNIQQISVLHTPDVESRTKSGKRRSKTKSGK